MAGPSSRASVQTDPDTLLPEADYGKLPFDIFMLEKWNNESPDNDATQRRFLCDYWVQLGSIVRKRYESSAAARVNLTRPTDVQIARILAPLQTHRERNFSARPRKFPCAWLRTCYDPDTNAAHHMLLTAVGHQALLAQLRSDDALLDSPLLYNFDADWSHVFERLPALLNGDPDRTGIRRAKREAVRDVEYDVDVYGDEASGEDGKVAPDWRYVQVLSKIGFLFVADAAALRKGENVLLVWYDDCGRLVRQTRVEPAKVVEVFEGHRSGWLYDVDSVLWNEAEVGPAYQKGGQCGPPASTDTAAEYWESDEDTEIY